LLVVCVTGMPGSGKSSFAKSLSSLLNAKLIVMGDVVREEVKRRGLPITITNVELVATELRKAYGRGAVGAKVAEMLRGSGEDYVIVDGVRSPEEISYLRSLGDLCVVAVHAAPSIRYTRQLSRAREGQLTLEELRFRDSKNLEYGIGDVIAMADYMIINEGSAKELEGEARRLAEAIRGGLWRGRCGGRG